MALHRRNARLGIGTLVFVLLAASLTGARRVQAASPLSFEVQFAPTVSRQPFTGRLYVMLGQGFSEPRFGPDWFRPAPFFALDVKNLQPGQRVQFGDNALGFPGPLSRLAKGAYAAQAVLDLNRGDRNFSVAPGNGYSRVARFKVDGQTQGPVPLVIDQVVEPRPFHETNRVKLVEVNSPLLSGFYCRPTRLRAGVVLPRSFADQPQARFPVIYDVPGFGGNHYMAHNAARAEKTQVAGVDMLYVVLDPDCTTGHSVFADSANNGPWGRALVEELIPAIEQRYRASAAPGARFLTGHSSGGWSSLWLQVTYPDFFGGTWSTSPDPVDFRDFQRINLYQPGENMFVDRGGQPRPIARQGNQPVLFYKPFSDMEVVMGHGGQLGSFEAVFSPRDSGGRPMQLWDRKTGAINPTVARAWEACDIQLVLERNWKTLGPKLAGKLHIFTGGLDTFYLEGAVARLRETLQRLGSDAEVEILPGRTHNLVDAALRQRIEREMAAAFKRRMSPQVRVTSYPVP